MNEVKTLTFFDVVNQDTCFTIVRADKKVVALALSLEGNGDIEVFLPVDACNSLIEVLNQAVALADGS